MDLLIDDQRTNIYTDLIARTPKAGILVLENLVSLIETLYIDHDLGSSLSGYDVIQMALDRNCLPNRVVVVSQNPVGCRAIQDILLEYGYKKVSNSKFEKEG